MKTVWQRIKQTARLMVGVGDYQAYVQHCLEHHPQHKAMTEKEYFLHRLNARYPSKDGKINRCPC